MGGIKRDIDINSKDKVVMNTTIDKDILKSFKEKCKNNGVSMNFIIEIFMEQYSNDEFKLAYKKNGCPDIKVLDINPIVISDNFGMLVEC